MVMLLKAVLNSISTLAADKNKRIYLVGGFLRDLYLGHPGQDLDFAVNGNAMGLAQFIAETMKGVYIPLDRINRVARVVLETQVGKWQIDFSSFKGLSIEDDLANRDFTINATALELSDYIVLSDETGALAGQRSERWRWHEKILDPYSGLTDIENKTIRAINDYVFEADPVRILRGVRLAGKLGFSIKPETLALMEQNRWLLQEVSGERAWEELSAILALPQSYPLITILDNIGALSILFPIEELMKVTDQKRHQGNVWAHSLRTYELLEQICTEPAGELEATGGGGALRELALQHLEQPLTAGRRRLQLIKIAALLHDPGKAVTARVLADGQVDFPGHPGAGLEYVGEFARRFKISKTEEAYLKNIVGNHMYPLSLYMNRPVSPAAIHRFFTRLGKEVTDILLLSLANVAAGGTGGEKEFDLPGYRAFTGDLLHKYYFEAGTYVQPPVLVKGEDLINTLKLPPSKRIGELLEKIAEAQVSGEVTNRDEAIAYAANLLEEDKTGE
jgi:poly(A) polymerase